MTGKSSRSIGVAVSLAAVLGLLLQGCVGAVVGAGATAGTAAMEERGISGAVEDTELRLRINALFSSSVANSWGKPQIVDGYAWHKRFHHPSNCPLIRPPTCCLDNGEGIHPPRRYQVRL